MKKIEGGVCAAKGFRAGGIHVGVKSHNTDKKDIALIVSAEPCAAAAFGFSSRNATSGDSGHMNCTRSRRPNV